MMKKNPCILAGALLAAMPVAAQAECQSFDTGQYAIGQHLSGQERTQLMTRQEAGNEPQCTRDGGGCSVTAPDGSIIEWRQDGIVTSKTIILSPPSRLPGWRGKIDQQLAAAVSRATCTTFRLEEDDSGLSASDTYLKREHASSRTGEDYVTTIFGAGQKDDPLTVQMVLGS